MTRHNRCRACTHFRNEPAALEAAVTGLRSLASAYGSTRAEDGLCTRHDRHVSATAGCDDFAPAKERR